MRRRILLPHVDQAPESVRKEHTDRAFAPETGPMDLAATIDIDEREGSDEHKDRTREVQRDDAQILHIRPPTLWLKNQRQGQCMHPDNPNRRQRTHGIQRINAWP